MSDDKAPPRLPFDTPLHAALAYGALLSFFFGPVLAWLGLQVSESRLRWLISVGVALPLLGLGYLYRRYQRVKGALAAEDRVPRPEWLWTLLTGSVTHQKHGLSDEPQVMVLAPDGARHAAEQMREVYNGKRSLLLFHCLPAPDHDVVNEEFGATLDKDKVRRLEDLGAAMNDCAALVLLDESTWRKYERTREAVTRWSFKHTVRPILSVRYGGGGGSLHYNDCQFADVVRESKDDQKVDREFQPLLSLLLSQAENRSERWRRQAGLHRRLALGLLAATLILMVVFVCVGYLWRSRLATLERVTAADPNEHAQVADALAFYRSAADEGQRYERFRRLLNTSAHQLRDMLARSSGRDSGSMEVIMFSVAGDRDRVDDQLEMREVAATRALLEDPFRATRNSPHVDSIVGCAVAARAFVIWTGESSSGEARTQHIEAWDFQGRPVGEFWPARQNIKIGDQTCSYGQIRKDLYRRQILCVPVGIVDKKVGQATGAVCVSVENPAGFLSEEWVRRTILNLGNSLTFTSWETALPTAPTPTPEPNRPR